MKYIKCIIIDDEELARLKIKGFLKQWDNVVIVAQCKNAIEAIQIIQNEKIDLLFLDIEMPKLTGTEMLQSLTHQPKVIFTTAYANFALEGYQHNTADYLVKPFGIKRFTKALTKAISQIELDSLKESNDISVDSEKMKRYVVIKSSKEIQRIFYHEIMYIQSMKEYVAYYIEGGKKLTLGSLKKLEQQLPEDTFLRTHKSYIVNTSFVKSISDNHLFLGNIKIPVGATYKERVISRLF